MHSFRVINGISIDDELVPLIQQIWDMDIETVGCCQEIPVGVPANFFGPGYAWIRFKTIEGYSKFMKSKCVNSEINKLFFEKGNFHVKIRHWRKPQFGIGCDLYFKKEMIGKLM